MPKEVSIYEVGPRDGLQNETAVLPTARKVEMIRGLLESGIKRIEVTSFVNPRWIPALADHMEVAAAVHKLERADDVVFSALVPNMRGLDSATRAGMKEVAIFMAASQTHNLKNINKSTEKALATYTEVVREALDRGMRVRGYISCVYGCPYEGNIPVEQVIEVSKALSDMGLYELSLGDTVGVGTPRQVEHVLQQLLEAGLTRDKMAVHFHDTRGTALANITVALQMGITTIDSAAGGLGGCPYAPGASGNVASEDVVYMLQGMGCTTGVDLDRLVATSSRLAGHLGHELPSKYLKAHIGHCTRSMRSV